MIGSTRPLFAIATLLLVIAALTGCKSSDLQRTRLTSNSDVQISPDPNTELLKGILDRTRLAMSHVVTYRTKGTATEAMNHGEQEVSFLSYSEHQSPERYAFGDRYFEHSDIQFIEWEKVDLQNFQWNSEPIWQEIKPNTGPMSSTPLSETVFESLNEDTVRLIAIDELSDDGVEVYRIQSTESHSQIVGGKERLATLVTTAVLIDKQTFQVVSAISDKLINHDPADDESWQITHKYDYYDYNQPIVVNVPNEYVP